MVGAESIGDKGGFDSLLLESSSSSSTSSSSAWLTCVSLDSSVSSGTDNLDNGSCWLLCDLNEPKMFTQPFVRLLLFSFTFRCFERIQPLKSRAVAVSFINVGVCVDDGGTFFAFEFASDVNLSDEILQLGMFFSTSLEMGRLGADFANFLSILPLVLGTITGDGFFVGGGDIVILLISQSFVVELVLPFGGDTVLRYLASPPLFLCTVAGLRNSDVLFATSTDIVSLFFLILGC